MVKYQRGEVWAVDLGIAAKPRPCLIINTVISDQDRALVTFIPHTTSLRRTKFEVIIDVNFLKKGAFDVQNVNTVSHAHRIKKLGTLSPEQITKVEHTLREWLGL